MPDLEFTKGTDAEHEIKLTSSLVYATWQTDVAYGGQKVGIEVGTAFVGNGAKIKIKGRSEQGKKLGKLTDTIRNNKFVGQLEVPDDIEIGDEVYYEVEISKNNISGESDRIPARPAIQVTNMRWSAAEARRGETVALSADLAGVGDGTEVKVTIYEYDQNNAHDKIAELPAIVSNEQLEISWEYQYYEDADEIPTQEEIQRYGGDYNPPEYFFTVTVGQLAFGREQDSGLLRFKDWIEVRYRDADGNPVANAEYVLTLPDGEEREGSLDSDGFARVEDVPPGVCQVRFIDPPPDN